MNLLPVHADAEGFTLMEALSKETDQSLSAAFLTTVLGQPQKFVESLFEVDQEGS